MGTPLVSIIIPVFNIEKLYFNQCYESVIYQSYQNIEIIIVDDGSEKKCSDFINKCIRDDKRSIVIHIQNSGVSTARNIGIDIATGEYIMFLDADDWMELCTIEKAVNWIETSKSDIISWNHYYYKNGKDIPREIIPNSPIIYKNNKLDDLAMDMITPEYDIRYNNIYLGAVRGVWGKLYRRAIIKENKVYFLCDLKIGEDACFNLQCLKYVKQVTFYNEYLNHYRVVNESANRRYREDIAAIRLSLLNEYRKYFSDRNDVKVNTCYTREVLSCVVNCLKKHFCSKSNKKSKSEKLNEIRLLLNDDCIMHISEIEIDSVFFTGIEKILYNLIINKRENLLFLLGGLVLVWETKNDIC